MDLYCSLAPTRVRWLALLIAIAGAGPTSAAQSSEPAHPAAATTEQAYREVLGSAHRALAASHAGRAALLFEQAAQTDGEHVEAEIGISRAYLAAGEYRRALSYAHFASGEHEDSDAALAWLSYLEDRAGYVDRAVKRLRAALVRWPKSWSSAAAPPRRAHCSPPGQRLCQRMSRACVCGSSMRPALHKEISRQRRPWEVGQWSIANTGCGPRRPWPPRRRLGHTPWRVAMA